jgi:hypothetical protein
MRTTRATAAVERLKRRSGDTHYKMVLNSAGQPYLVKDEAGRETALCEPMPLEDFVPFVDAFGPQEKRRMTKNDVAFEAQLVKKTPGKE